MSLLKNLSMTVGVFFVVFVLSLVSAQNKLEVSHQSDLESVEEIQELLRNVQLIFEEKIASKVRAGTVPDDDDDEEEEEEEDGDENDPNKCGCSGLKCYCCKYIDIRKLHLRGDCCLSVAYLPRNYGILVTLTYGSRTLISKEISARNPLPICVRIPKLRIIGEICIEFYNLDIGKRHFSGCSRLLARVFYLTIVKIDVGCFHINFLNATQQVNEVDVPYLDESPALAEEPEPNYIREVLMGNIKRSGYKKNN